MCTLELAVVLELLEEQYVQFCGSSHRTEYGRNRYVRENLWFVKECWVRITVLGHSLSLSSETGKNIAQTYRPQPLIWPSAFLDSYPQSNATRG